jgi:hypothetical protein
MAGKTIDVIEWKDAVVDCGWEEKDKVKLECHTCFSMGLVVSENSDQIVLAATWSEEGDDFGVNNRIAIPKGWIVSRKTVKV